MIEDAVKKAYETAISRKWDTLYLMIDVHDTIFRSQYGGFANEYCVGVLPYLQKIAKIPEIKIILWSSSYPEHMDGYADKLRADKIHVEYCNENPEVVNTGSGCFEKKPYFNILIDDKAGFVAHKDWAVLLECIVKYRVITGFAKE